MREVTGARRRKSVPAAGVALLATAGLVLAGCNNDGAGVEDAGSDVTGAAGASDTSGADDAGSAEPDPSAAGDAPAESSDGAPEPTPGAAPDQAPAPGVAAGDTGGADGAGEGDTADAPAAPGPEQLELADYVVPLNAQETMTCMFRESQEADGFDWGCQADNFDPDWEATRGGDANGIAYRTGGDPVLFGLLGNAAGINLGGTLDDGSVSDIGDRFSVDLTQPDAALITVDGVTTRVTDSSYDIVG